MEECTKAILEACKKNTGTDPAAIFMDVAGRDFVRIHGPEHHVLDGAAVLTACHNAGLAFDLEDALARIRTEGLKMPGAACGFWGVCGAVTSIGAALAILDHTGPLTTDGSWGKHMEFTSAAIARMGKVNGPRCCKRDGFIALETAVAFINENYPITLTAAPIHCHFSPRNEQCLHERCPFFGGVNDL